MEANENYTFGPPKSEHIDIPSISSGLFEQSSSPEASSSTQETLLTEIDDLDVFMQDDMKYAKALQAEEYGQADKQVEEMEYQNGEME